MEFGFLGGAAGDLATTVRLLLAWRIYANGIGTALGIWLAIRHYGLAGGQEGGRTFGGRAGWSQPGGGPIDTQQHRSLEAPRRRRAAHRLAPTSVPASATRVSSPTVILAFPESTK